MTDQIRKILVFAVGDSEVGTAIADRLVEAGHEAILATSDGALAKGKAQRHIRFDPHAANLESEVAKALQDAGPINALVLADLMPDKTSKLEELSSEEWRRLMRTNATLGFLVCRNAVPLLSQSKDGRIVFLLPEDVRGTPRVEAMPHTVAKASLVGLMRTLALELGVSSITANAVACPMATSGRATARRDLPGVGEIFATVAFLLSPASGFLTGQVVDVNGGRSML